MRIALPLVLAAGLALFSSPAAASEWIEITESTDGTVLLFDLDSIRRADAIKTLRPFPVIQGWIRFREPDGAEIRMFQSVDCSGITAATLKAMHYKSDGAFEGSSSYKDLYLRYEPIAPDTLDYAAYRVFCGLQQFDR